MKSNHSYYKFATVRRDDLANINEFVDVWSKSYAYQNMTLYTEPISKEHLEIDDLRNLFEWKNGMTLSGKKTEAFEQKILTKIGVVNELKKAWDERLFENEFSGLTTIWKVFLMHIIQPAQYPIFDQHVFRAFKFITNQTPDAVLPSYDKARFPIYKNEYLPFYSNCAKEMHEKFTLKNLDDALWTFGKFLSDYPKLFSVVAE